jgi:HEAT repeat protein
MTIQVLIDEYKAIFANLSTKKEYVEVIEYHKELSRRISELNSPIEEISLALNQYIDNACDRDLNFWLEAAAIHPSLNYLESLCSLLEQENNCIWHEGIIYALEKLNDERAIPALKRAILHDLNYENTKQVAVTAMEALAKIGTNEAIEVLQVCRKYPDNLVRRTARDILKAIKEAKDAKATSSD